MNADHKIRTLRVYPRFDSEALAMDCQKPLTVFVKERLPKIMDEVLSRRSHPGLIHRFDRVELDLGTIAWDGFSDDIERIFRKKLIDFLDDHPVLSEPVSSPAVTRQLASAPVEEEVILHFLEHGILPWYGSFSSAGDMAASLERCLGTGALHFIKRLKDAPNMITMVKRLIRQFPETVIEKILETAAPGWGWTTRQVIGQLEMLYAAKPAEKTEKISDIGADVFQKIKVQAWEHPLLVALGGRGISSRPLKLDLPEHVSVKARQEISRILQHLPGSSAMAMDRVGPHHPDTWPISSSSWDQKIQHGPLSLYGSFFTTEEMTAFLEKCLGTEVLPFIDRLKDAPDMATLVKRLIREFPETVIEKILETAAPGWGRATREVIGQLDALYAAERGGKTGKNSDLMAEAFQEIKGRTWEHTLLVALGGRGISSHPLKPAWPEHVSAKIRKKISRILQHLPGASAVALDQVVSHHPDNRPIPPSFWDPKIQLAIPPLHGSFPSAGDMTAFLKKSLGSGARAFLDQLQDVPDMTTLVKRLIEQFPETVIEKILETAAPGWGRATRQVIGQLDALYAAEAGENTGKNSDIMAEAFQEIKGRTWEHTLLVALGGRGISSHPLKPDWPEHVPAKTRQEISRILRHLPGASAVALDRVVPHHPDNRPIPPFFGDPKNQHGIPPLYGSFSSAGDMTAFLEKCLGPGALSFIDQLKDAPDMTTLVKRLIGQFPETVIEKILETAAPGWGRATREVIGQLDALYAVETDEQTGKNSGIGADDFQKIKIRTWEHTLLVVLEGREISSNPLKLDLPKYVSPKARQEISLILRHLPVSGSMAMNQAAPYHPAACPMPPSFWAQKIQDAFQKSGKISDGLSETDFPRIWGEVILRCFDALAENIQVKPAPTLGTYPVSSMTARQEHNEGERELQQAIMDHLMNKCPGKQTSGGQMILPAKGGSVRTFSKENVSNGVNNPDHGIRAKAEKFTLKNEITKDPADTAMVGPSIKNSVGPGATDYNIYLKWIQRLLDCLRAMSDKDVSAPLTEKTLPVIGEMILDATVSMAEPEMFLAELSSMVARQMTGVIGSYKKTGRQPLKRLIGELLSGDTWHWEAGRDESESAFSQNLTAKVRKNLRAGTLWPVIISETWSRILTSGLSSEEGGPDCSSDKKASYLPVMDTVVSISPEKRELFSIRVLFRFAERMQLPINPFSDLPGPEIQNGTATDSKAGNDLVLTLLRQFIPKNGGSSLTDPDLRIDNCLENLSTLFQDPKVQKNIRSNLSLEAVWDVIQAILHSRIREKGFETIREKLKSDAWGQPQKSPDDKKDDSRHPLADKLSLILKSESDPKDFLLRVLTGLASGEFLQDYGSGEGTKNSIPPADSVSPGGKLGEPPLEKHVEQVGGSRPKWTRSTNQPARAVDTHPAGAFREWDDRSEPVFIENAGMVLAGPYLSMLFRKLDLLADKKFKSRYAAEKAVHILEYMVTGEQKTVPEYRLALNKLLCGIEGERPIHQFFLFDKTQTDLTRQLILSMISHWKVLGKTSVEGFRESFLAREGRLEKTKDAWNLVVAPKPFDMLLDRIPWTFSPIRLPWMDRGLYIRWR